MHEHHTFSADKNARLVAQTLKSSLSLSLSLPQAFSLNLASSICNMPTRCSNSVHESHVHVPRGVDLSRGRKSPGAPTLASLPLSAIISLRSRSGDRLTSVYFYSSRSIFAPCLSRRSTLRRIAIRVDSHTHSQKTTQGTTTRNRGETT